MSDLKKCRLGNLSNKGKLLVRECCWMRILYKRPEDSMDYIYRTLSFQNSPSFPTVTDPCKLDCKARVEQGRIPKALASKTVPRVAKCILQVRSLCPLGLPKSRVDPPKRNTLLV
jgi:hypothetical protein